MPQGAADPSASAAAPAITTTTNLSYVAFCNALLSASRHGKSLEFPGGVKPKLALRKKYCRFLKALHSYLVLFLGRTEPLLDIREEVMKPALLDFEKEWKEGGGAEKWGEADKDGKAAAPARGKMRVSFYLVAF